VSVAAGSFDAVVVGAGHNGLVCGAYLAKGGLRTLVLERRARPGGAVSTEEIAPGFRVPALAHTVGRLRRSVARDLGLKAHGLRVVSPHVRVFAPQPDGERVVLWRDPARTAEGLRKRSEPDAEAYPRFDRKLRALASFVAHMQAATPPELSSPSFGDALTGLRLARAIRGLGSGRNVREALRLLPMSVADLVSEAFEDDALRAAIAFRGVQYTAMGPRAAGTAAVLLADTAGTDGGAAGQCAFVLGGPGALADALVSAARGFGAEIRCGAEVARVVTGDGRVAGVALASGEEVAAPIVVSDLDPKRTLLDLVDPMETGPTLRWRAENLRLPGTLAKVNLALDAVPRFLAAAGEAALVQGRIVIAPGLDQLERAADDAKYGRISERPFLEATIPSLVDDSLAPQGKHVMSVLVQHAPYSLRENDWDARRDAVGDLVLRTLEDHAPGIGSMVTERQVITPLDLERDYGLTGGHPMHGEPGLDQFFAWRPLYGLARYRLVPDGLWLCGAGAHPAGGVTGAPGANAAREILASRRRAR
jgi:phytoene dehydrogenase-like protein